MPLSTIASAVSRMSSASISQPNVFQLFHPIDGVWTSSVNFLASSYPSVRSWACTGNPPRIKKTAAGKAKSDLMDMK